MRKLALAAVIALALPAAHAAAVSQDAAPTAQAPYLAAAINDPARQADRVDDARRKIAQVMAFAQVEPGDKVLELIPGSGYFTRVFSGVVGPKGHVYALWPDEYAAEAKSDVANLRKLAGEPHYANVSVLTQPAAKLDAPESVDVVFTSQNYHDYPDKFMGKVDPVVLDRQVYNVLKPGGVFVVIDHVAPAGSGMRDTDTLHRIDPAIVKQQAKSVGFVFDGESDALRNPADPHDIKVFDKSIRGHTDQFMYRFRKPAN
ncbi:class I SAM-dependent methyltransferase [Frateuria hangzhouensis]|uniref:class I SAM-dependent methyltransferase n=1 Tax=Frateuria hangzhouensis TaxID=2995589 RepID=UPI002260A42B|nr:methyltransferase domain-containing protein [Frateuria sp. STR12]MCX7514401.1 methyltransferase domain-containing protein [Frateuria sp. STR12]